MKTACRINGMVLVTMVSVFLLASPVWSQFSYPGPTGLRSMAIGGAGVGGLNDTFTGLLNPASIVKVNETRLAFETLFEQSDLNVENKSNSSVPDSSALDSITVSPSIASVLNFGSSKFSMGIYAHTRDVKKQGFSRDSLLRYHLRDFRFRSSAFDVSLGVIPIPDFSFGVTLGYLTGSGSFERYDNPLINSPDPDPDLDVKWTIDYEDIAEFTAAAGMLWSPNYRFDLGVMIQPPSAYHFKSELAVDIPESLGGITYRSDIEKVRITIPAAVQIGTHWIATDRIDLFADLRWTQFSQIDDINLAIKQPRSPFIPSAYEYPLDLKDRWSLHAGMEIMTSDRMTLRFGVFHATESSESSTSNIVWALPQQTGLSAGLDFRLFGWNAEISASHILSGVTRNHLAEGSVMPAIPISEVDVSEDSTTVGIGISRTF